jgi:hypothetical protein
MVLLQRPQRPQGFEFEVQHRQHVQTVFLIRVWYEAFGLFDGEVLEETGWLGERWFESDLQTKQLFEERIVQRTLLYFIFRV